MPYNAISNIIFLCAIVGLILLVLRRLPEAVASEQSEAEARRSSTAVIPPPRNIWAVLYGKLRAQALFWGKRMWNFSLEAKGLRHTSLANYRIKKMFRARKREPVAVQMQDVSRVSADVVQDENSFLLRIKEDPHNLSHYNSLGQYYLGQNNFKDAHNVFEYLIKKDATNGSYYAKLAYCKLSMKQYDAAAVMYEKSLALDSGHPNRYYNLALAYRTLGKMTEARGAAAKALEHEPNNAKYNDLASDLELKQK